MIALPVGIVANAFSDVIHRRDFIVTWSMVARVPIFSHLTAGDIAHVMQLLRARQVEKGEIIARRGDVAHAMYFVTEGEVEIELRPGQSVKLGQGSFSVSALCSERPRDRHLSSPARVPGFWCSTLRT